MIQELTTLCNCDRLIESIFSGKPKRGRIRKYQEVSGGRDISHIKIKITYTKIVKRSKFHVKRTHIIASAIEGTLSICVIKKRL